MKTFNLGTSDDINHDSKKKKNPKDKKKNLYQQHLKMAQKFEFFYKKNIWYPKAKWRRNILFDKSQSILDNYEEFGAMSNKRRVHVVGRFYSSHLPIYGDCYETRWMISRYELNKWITLKFEEKKKGKKKKNLNSKSEKRRYFEGA